MPLHLPGERTEGRLPEVRPCISGPMMKSLPRLSNLPTDLTDIIIIHSVIHSFTGFAISITCSVILDHATPSCWFFTAHLFTIPSLASWYIYSTSTCLLPNSLLYETRRSIPDCFFPACPFWPPDRFFIWPVETFSAWDQSIIDSLLYSFKTLWAH